MQGLHTEHSARGLRIFTFERQGSSPEAIIDCINSRGGAGYAVSAGGSNAYNGGRGIPFAWVIGVDGKVVYAGNPGRPEFDQTIEAELAKVKYPGLGRLDIHKDLDKAARQYITDKWGDAIAEANDLLAKEGTEEAAKADAEFLVKRITARYEAMVGEAQKLESQKRYLAAQAIYERIYDLFGRGTEWGDSAKDKLTEFRRDRDIKAEMKAEEELEKLKEKVAQMKAQGAPADRLLKEVEKFVKRYDGTAAAKRASDELASIINGGGTSR